MVLQLISVIQTATDNLNANTLLEYFMIHNIFEALVKIIAEPETSSLAADASAILVVFCNYAKYEKQNPYLMQLSTVSDRPALLVFGLSFFCFFVFVVSQEGRLTLALPLLLQ